jgi:hypothetical protein
MAAWSKVQRRAAKKRRKLWEGTSAGWPPRYARRWSVALDGQRVVIFLKVEHEMRS